MQLTLYEHNELQQCEAIIERGLRTFVDVGGALLKIRDSKLYRQDYSTFEDYCKQKWAIKRQRAYELMDAAVVVSHLSEISDILPAREAHAAPLANLDPEQQREAWAEIIETAPATGITGAYVSEVVDRKTKPHVTNNSGENEWYTPSEYIEAARFVMGNIDIDPASSDTANKTVKATTYYTISDNGLEQRWEGNVWMNPPYAQPLVTEFTDELVKKWSQGEIKQACVLVNNATETAWYQSMLRVVDAICLIRGRIKFIDKEGNPSGAPLQGQTVLYFGDNIEGFAATFSKLGKVLYAR